MSGTIVHGSDESCKRRKKSSVASDELRRQALGSSPGAGQPSTKYGSDFPNHSSARPWLSRRPSALSGCNNATNAESQSRRGDSEDFDQRPKETDQKARGVLGSMNLSTRDEKKLTDRTDPLESMGGQFGAEEPGMGLQSSSLGMVLGQPTTLESDDEGSLSSEDTK